MKTNPVDTVSLEGKDIVIYRVRTDKRIYRRFQDKMRILGVVCDLIADGKGSVRLYLDGWHYHPFD